jgi:hypothetical protein
MSPIFLGGEGRDGERGELWRDHEVDGEGKEKRFAKTKAKREKGKEQYLKIESKRRWEKKGGGGKQEKYIKKEARERKMGMQREKAKVGWLTGE